MCNDSYNFEKKRQRGQSFDLANFMRKDDYMLNLLKDENTQGSLKIIKPPTPTDVIALKEATTPPSLVDRTNTLSDYKRDEEMKGPEFVFYDVHDDEKSRVNEILEEQILATSMQSSFGTEDPHISFQDCQLVNENPLLQGAKSQNGEKNPAESAENWTENDKKGQERESATHRTEEARESAEGKKGGQ